MLNKILNITDYRKLYSGLVRKKYSGVWGTTRLKNVWRVACDRTPLWTVGVWSHGSVKCWRVVACL